VEGSGQIDVGIISFEGVIVIYGSQGTVEKFGNPEYENWRRNAST
jgi:tetrahydromethanopterin S-methyltransferase subunit D